MTLEQFYALTLRAPFPIPMILTHDSGSFLEGDVVGVSGIKEGKIWVLILFVSTETEIDLAYLEEPV